MTIRLLLTALIAFLAGMSVGAALILAIAMRVVHRRAQHESNVQQFAESTGAR